MSRIGFPINWDANPNDTAVVLHPLYVKYNLQSLDTINAADVKADLGGLKPTTESAAIAAYLSWLLRCLTLIA
jgi:hypothetical protein